MNEERERIQLVYASGVPLPEADRRWVQPIFIKQTSDPVGYYQRLYWHRQYIAHRLLEKERPDRGSNSGLALYH